MSLAYLARGCTPLVYRALATAGGGLTTVLALGQLRLLTPLFTWSQV